jgi:hypothetical protein
MLCKRTEYIILKGFITLGTLFSSVKIILTISQPLEQLPIAPMSWRHDRHVVILVFLRLQKLQLLCFCVTDICPNIKLPNCNSLDLFYEEIMITLTPRGLEARRVVEDDFL